MRDDHPYVPETETGVPAHSTEHVHAHEEMAQQPTQRAGNVGDGEHQDHGGYAGHNGHVGQFQRLFWIMLALAVLDVLRFLQAAVRRRPRTLRHRVTPSTRARLANATHTPGSGGSFFWRKYPHGISERECEYASRSPAHPRN